MELRYESPLDGKPPRARAGTQNTTNYLNRRYLWTCLSVVSTPVVYHQAMSDHASTQMIAKVMKAAFSPSSTCEHVSRSLKSACFVPCESCMAAAAVSLAQTGSLPLGCCALCGRGSPRARARSQVRSGRCFIGCLGSCPITASTAVFVRAPAAPLCFRVRGCWLRTPPRTLRRDRKIGHTTHY